MQTVDGEVTLDRMLESYLLEQLKKKEGFSTYQ